MCRKKNSPIEAKYRNSLFGDRADHCMVGVINHFNRDKDFATVASCCGHFKKKSVPYITLLQPRNRIAEVKAFLEKEMRWKDMLVDIFNDIPDDAWRQLGSFMVGKVYVGYYSEAAKLNIINLDEPWRGDDIQMDESQELLVHRL